MNAVIEYLNEIGRITDDYHCSIRLYNDESGAITDSAGNELFSFYGEKDLKQKIAALKIVKN